MTIELGTERTEEALRQAARQVANKTNVPGFRRGHAPFTAVVAHFGREALLNEIVDDLGQKVYGEALDTEHIEPYGQAALVDVDMDPLTFKLRVPLEPTVDLGDYTSIRLDAPAVNVGDADVDMWIDQRRAAKASLQDVERAAAMGDTVVVDITGQAGEDVIMDNHDWEIPLKEDGGWLPGFDQAFVGLSAGEEKTFTLTYPEDSTSRYKGQEATFHATVKQVRANVQPELDDEFAKSLGSYESVADLREKVKTGLTQQKQAEADDTLEEQAIEALIEHATMLAFPPVVVDEAIDAMMHDLEHRLADIGYKMEDYLRLQGTSVADYRESLRPQGERRAKGQLVLGKFAELEKVRVNPADIDARVARMTEAAADQPQAQQYIELLKSDQGRSLLAQDIASEKTLARLRARVTGQEIAEEETATEPTVEPAAEAADEPAAEAVTESPELASEEQTEATSEVEETASEEETAE
jgi:trigger factor